MTDTYQAIVTVEKVTSTDVEGEPASTTGILHVVVTGTDLDTLKTRVGNVLAASL